MKTRYKILALTSALLLVMAMVLADSLSAHALNKDGLKRGLKASVKLGILDANGDLMGTCSGTILNNQGLILTNFHCVGQTDIYGPDEEFGLEHGDLYNPDGLLMVAINDNTKKPPVPTYIAQFVAGNPDQDVAVIKIIGYLDGKTKLPKTLPVVSNVLADSDTVETGDEVTIIGYPGVGGDTITLTDGKISGFMEETDDDNTDWFKTDALINGGNSGGTAVNETGDVIGIPSAKLVEEADMIFFIKPVNQAIPIIERAMKADNAGTEINNGKSGGDNTIPKGQNFGTPTFGTGFGDKGLTGQNTTFKSSITEIHAALPYQDMKKSASWGYIWQYEGQDVLGESKLKWEFDKAGTLDLYIQLDDGLPDGEYNLQIYSKGKMVVEAGFVIGSADPKDKPKPPDEEDTGVLVSGTIINADTKKPIANAIIVFLVPGKTVDDFDNSSDMSTVLAVGVTDSKGQYVIDTPLPRGEVFSVLVGADGYQRISADDAFEATDDDPDLIELDPIELEKE